MLNVKKIWDDLKKDNSSKEFFNLITHSINGVNFHFLRRLPEGNLCFGIDLKYDVKISENFKNLSSLSLEKLNTSKDEEILVINLLEESLEEPFLEFIQTLVNNVTETKNNQEAQSIFLNKIMQFQKLFEKNNLGILSKNQIRGLFAELCFLEHLIKNTSTNAIYYWKGPLNGLHDFVTNNYSVEVKSYTSKNAVRILNERQLNSEVTNKLFLASYQILEVQNGMSINQKIELLNKNFDQKLKLFFISCLHDYGYFMTHSSEYDNIIFENNNQKLYEIKKDFPSNKITKLNPEIYNIKYYIDLTKCEKWQIDFDEHLKHYKNS